MNGSFWIVSVIWMRSVIKPGCTASSLLSIRVYIRMKKTTAIVIFPKTTRISIVGVIASGLFSVSIYTTVSLNIQIVWVRLDFNVEYIQEDVFNNSAWSHRFYVYTHIHVLSILIGLVVARNRGSWTRIRLCDTATEYSSAQWSRLELSLWVRIYVICWYSLIRHYHGYCYNDLEYEVKQLLVMFHVSFNVEKGSTQCPHSWFPDSLQYDMF